MIKEAPANPALSGKWLLNSVCVCVSIRSSNFRSKRTNSRQYKDN